MITNDPGIALKLIWGIWDQKKSSYTFLLRPKPKETTEAKQGAGEVYYDDTG